MPISELLRFCMRYAHHKLLNHFTNLHTHKHHKKVVQLCAALNWYNQLFTIRIKNVKSMKTALQTVGGKTCVRKNFL